MPNILVSGPNCLKLYIFKRSLIVGCPGAETFPTSRVPNVRYPPNFGQSIRDIKPFSPMTMAIIGTYLNKVQEMHYCLIMRSISECKQAHSQAANSKERKRKPEAQGDGGQIYYA